MLAVRARGLGKYFGPSLETDGVARPRQALQTLLRIAGLNVDTAAEDDVRRTMAATGHVLRDVSFEIEQGSVVCLAGPSGSGKSVLLEILAGVTAPTVGSVEIYAPVSHLLSVGDNLDPRHTARENIEASQKAAGVPPDDAARYAAEVIEFAELHGFEDAPIRTYSTGMVLRLSVALALCGRPSIVLIDDVLGVGDIAFQQKCVERVHALKEAGCTLVLAFGDEALVRQLATRVITLRDGRIVGDMPPHHWATARPSGGAAEIAWQVASEGLPESDVVALRSIAVAASPDPQETWLELTLVFEIKTGGVRCRPAVAVVRDATALFRSLYPEFVAVDRPGPLGFVVRVPTSILPGGDYVVALSMATLAGSAVLSLKMHDAATLAIRRDRASYPEPEAGALLAMTFPWEVERLASA